MPSMAKKLLLVTNNGRAMELYGAHSRINVDCLEERSYLDVLIRVRDLVHVGCRLMSHPQASNLKPNQSPYKTVLLSCGRGAQPLGRDVEMAESSVEAFYKFTKGMTPPSWPENTLRDFRMIDLSVAASAIERALMF